MLILIILKEIRHNILTLRFAVMYGLFFVLTVVSMVLLSANYQSQWENYVRSKAAERENLGTMESVHDLRWQGTKVQKEPSRLSLFSLGLDKEMSRSAFVSSRGGVEVGSSQYSNPISALFATPDLTYVVNIVISLLALLLTFDSVCGENEEGTLRLMLANAVPRDTILMGKWLGGYIALVVPFLLAVGIGFVLAALFTDLTLDAESWARAGTLMVLSLLYVSVFFTLGILISTFNHRSSTALMASLFIWVLIVLTVPNVVPILARQIAGIPSLGMLDGQRAAIENEQWRTARERMRGAPSDEERRTIHLEIRENIMKEWTRIQDEYENKIDRQIELAKMLSRLSPSASFVYAATNVAGTGIAEFRNLAEYTKQHQGSFAEVVDELSREERERETQRNVEETIDEAPFDVTRLPEFRPTGDSLARSLQGSMLDISLLVGFNIGFLLVSYIKFMRYDVCE
jgi:ABC-type transport system involved in multi-copper enzyme maturation permease subunit